MVSLGKEIKKARIDKGLNQIELKELTGISQKHISAIECDSVDPRWSMMKRLAKVLDLDLAQLAREDTADA
jgi:transcriptional regulator with XRE-family HTH domain